MSGFDTPRDKLHDFVHKTLQVVSFCSIPLKIESFSSTLLVILLRVIFTLWGCSGERGENERNPTECVGDSGVRVLMMITALQGLTAKSAAGQRRLPGDGLALPQDVFRQTPPAGVIDERQRSE